MQKLKSFWFIFLTSPFIFAFIIFSQKSETQAADQTILLPLGYATLVSLVLSLLLPELLFRNQISKQSGEISSEKAAQLYLVPFVLRLALSESICTYGLIVAMRSGPNWIQTNQVNQAA